MVRYELVTLLESIKRRYCKAVKEHKEVIMMSELHRMNQVRTKLYLTNKNMKLDIFNEQIHA